MHSCTLLVFINLLRHIYTKAVFLLFKTKAFIGLNAHIIFSIKLITSILFLIIMRVGVPRFRYDHLSKLG